MNSNTQPGNPSVLPELGLSIVKEQLSSGEELLWFDRDVGESKLTI
jgi:hypothetical protein